MRTSSNEKLNGKSEPRNNSEVGRSAQCDCRDHPRSTRKGIGSRHGPSRHDDRMPRVAIGLASLLICTKRSSAAAMPRRSPLSLAASFFCRFTKGFTYDGGISRTS